MAPYIAAGDPALARPRNVGRVTLTAGMRDRPRGVMVK
jgi:hypothetical protein